MRRCTIVAGVAALALAGAAVPAGAFGILAPSRRAPAPPAAAPAALPRSCLVADWPLSRRIDQLLLVSGEFSDLGASAGLARAGAGGFVLFGQPPAGSGPSIRSGIAALDAAASRAGQTKPWMSTDEEGGAVQRLVDVIGNVPAPRTMAETMTPTQVQALMAGKARQMAALGVDVDLAPVVDTAPADDLVADENQRSFSDSAQTVIAYSRAYIAGLEEGGVVPTVKHFPGLGHASADTDDGPATDPPLSSLQGRDLRPFVDAAERQVPVVMIGHPMVPGLTGGQPASMSPAAYDYLRQQLGFSGVVVTDSLAAGAISAAGYTEASAAVRAVASGADMVLIDAADAGSVEAALAAAVARGTVPVDTLDRDVGLILTAKGATPCAVAPPRRCGVRDQPAAIADAVADPAVPGGYWDAYADGCVTAHGGAPSIGSYAGSSLAAPVVAMAPTSGGHGYWLVTAEGQVLPFGATRSYGSAGRISAPITGIAAGPGNAGYWLVGGGGRVFAFGRATNEGSVFGDLHGASLSRVTGIAAVPSADGYWITAADGAVYAFGAARQMGGTTGEDLPVTAIVARDGAGYWQVGENGRVVNHGDAPFAGTGNAVPTTSPAVGLVPLRSGYELILQSGQAVAFT